MNNCQKCSCQDCPTFSHSVFKGLNENVLNQLKEIKTVRTFKKGHSIITQGFPSPGFFCSMSGKLKYTLVGNLGNETVIGLSRPGEFIASLTEDSPFTVVAIENATTCFFPREAMRELMSKEPELAFRMFNYSLEQAQQTQVRLSSLIGKNVRERVRMLLHELTEYHGVKRGGVIEITTQLSRDELSSMVGVATETLIRMLSEFKDEGILEQSGRKMLIAKPEKLSPRVAMTA
ncbi:MAG: Crp/Fnr family transcriptional regulator [Bacteriovoracaceae bacterium]|nr:Crp/Fnr family transcriptional regulator [Bacteriovoracaceae bacterium]